jgi:tripartite-type tricarboxylate transporter receptor subunit TctC
MLSPIALRRLAALAVLSVSAGTLSARSAQADNFYDGKTITVITSTGSGGTYDLVARLVSRHMPQYLPGHPPMIVQNMPGGGNVLATNYMYAIAPKDGTSIATIHNAMPLHQVLDGRGVRYDASKFNWLGSTGPENEVIVAWHTAGVRTIQDAMKKELILGGTGAGSGIVIIPTAMNNVLGTRFKIVIGYKSSEDINLAMERGEVQARAFSMSSIVSQHPDWIKEKKVAFLAQVGTRREKDIPDVPLATELAKTDEQRAILKLISAPPALGQPYLTPPGVPEERVAVLRKAFMATLHDKAFLADAAKSEFDIDAMDADEVARIVDDTIGAPAAIVAKAKAAMESPDAQPQGKAASKP